MKKLLLLLLLPLMAFTQDTIVDPPPPPPPPDYGEELTDTLSLFDSWVEVSFQFDNYAEEVSWYLYNTTDTIYSIEEGEYDGEIDAYHFIELNSGDYTFELLDSWGDGLSWPENGWSLVFNNCQDTLFYAEGNYGLGLIESLTIAPCAPPIEGCTDEVAINYNEEAFSDDGSCEYIEGCTNENASNYDPEAGVFPSGLIFPGGSCNTIVWGQNYFGVDPDFYFNGNQDIFEVGNKLYIGENTFYVDFVAEVQGNCNAPAVLIYVCYTEAEADGNLGTFSPGLNVNAVVGEYWYMDPCTFIYGCTDENALNYNPDAGVNDGSCINIPGCTNPTSNMYNPAATIDASPISSGAIRDAFEPTKTLSPTTVLFLFSPS